MKHYAMLEIRTSLVNGSVAFQFYGNFDINPLVELIQHNAPSAIAFEPGGFVLNLGGAPKKLAIEYLLWNGWEPYAAETLNSSGSIAAGLNQRYHCNHFRYSYEI